MSPPDEIFSIPEPDETPEEKSARTLWRSVVAQAIRDMGISDPEIALEAVQWLGTDDYEICCDLAGINARWLSREIGKVTGLKPIYRAVFLRKLAQIINSGLTCSDGVQDISYSRDRQEF